MEIAERRARVETVLSQAGSRWDALTGAVAMPIYQTATFRHPALGQIASYPATMSHAAMPPSERERRGITGGLVRLSVGLETAEDLIADLEQALAQAGAQSNREAPLAEASLPPDPGGYYGQDI